MRDLPVNSGNVSDNAKMGSALTERFAGKYGRQPHELQLRRFRRYVEFIGDRSFCVLKDADASA